MRSIASLAALAALTTLTTIACGDSTDGEELDTEGTPNLATLPEDVTLPIVFLHGFVGSAQQYESQAMRFAANGYPAERIVAIDHHGISPDTDALMAEVEQTMDDLMAKYDSEQVFLVGHSRGTSMSNTFLGDPARAAKVAKYVSLDGRGCTEAEAAGVPCIDPHQNDPAESPDHEIPGQAHVEIATSAEAFAMQYEFFVGEQPEVVDIVRQRGPVTISGRVVDFPSNMGRPDVTLKLYEIDHGTGERLDDAPQTTLTTDALGDFGPLEVSPDAYYEFELSSGEVDSFHHFYMQRFLRDSHLVRLLSGDPDTSATRQATNAGPDHAAMVVLRMREWYAEEDEDFDRDERDLVEITTEQPDGGEPATNVLRADIGNGTIALHVHDDAESPGDSSLDELSAFASNPLLQPFQGSVDLFMPASDPPDGTITVKNTPRGDGENPQVLRMPNWSSDRHYISVVFSDYAQPASSPSSD